MYGVSSGTNAQPTGIKDLAQSQSAPSNQPSLVDSPALLSTESLDQTQRWDQRASSLEKSPRARNSASWKRSSPLRLDIDSDTEGAGAAATLVEGGELEKKLLETTMLPTVARRKVRDDMEASNDPRRRPKSTWSCSLWTSITTVLALFLLLSVVQSFLHRQVDPQGCAMSAMRPTYIKLSGFDSEHSRFASKYSLYLYREEGIDQYTEDDVGLRGSPVLFLPGNAGSFKQVRSLSSEVARYFHNVVQHDTAAIRAGVTSLDFFMIDFNEDLAAFHGQTILDQADYVNEAMAYLLSLYQDPGRSRRDPSLPDPCSVILIGHSMGGIVARTVLIMPNYQSDSVNTIITMSTPHARPPLSFDADMVHTYQRVNDYWRTSYAQPQGHHNPLSHTTLISFAGGGRDTTVPSEYSTLSSIVPESHGFAVFTSTIPGIWTGMDHLAITWCDQFRKVLTKTLFDIVDVRRASQTKPRMERMETFRKMLLTGLEPSAPKTLPTKGPTFLLTLGSGPRSHVVSSTKIIMREFGSIGQANAQLLSLPSGTTSSDKLVTLLTDQTVDRHGDFEKLTVLFCSNFPLPSGHSQPSLPLGIDLSDGSPSATRLACEKAGEDVIRLPASTRTSRQAFDRARPFTYLQYTTDDVEGHQFLAIINKGTETTEGWLLAEVAETSKSFIDVDIGLPKLLRSGLHLELPADRAMMTDIRVSALQSSLLAYSLKLGHLGCGGDGELFTPLLRQHLEQPHESKFFVNVKEADINLHGVTPFIPPALKGNEPTGGVSFQLWTDTTCDASLDLSLELDIVGSLGKLVMRYRTLLVTFPLLVVALVLRHQFRSYDETGVFTSFTESLDRCLRTSLPLLLLALTLFATPLAQSATSGFQPSQRSNGTEAAVNYTQNDLFLGSSDPFFWFLVPFSGMISVGACVAVNYLVLLISSALCAGYPFLTTRMGGQLRQGDAPEGYTSSFWPGSPQRRLINTSILLLLVAFVIPYQFAYLVACIIQLATSTRALKYSQEKRTVLATNFSNYVHSVSMLMLWILPINLPVLVVWIHNLSVQWLAPFSSHHDILSIMPFILLVETLTSGNMIPTINTKVRYVTNLLFFGLAVFSAMYGITYAYMLHHLVNLVVTWLVFVHFAYAGGTWSSRLRSLADGDAFTDSLADDKKMP
jgi:GPI inositol-deacylase